MNKSYRTVWNEALGAWVAASEITKARGKRSRSAKAVAAAVTVLVGLGGWSDGWALTLGNAQADNETNTMAIAPGECADPAIAGAPQLASPGGVGTPQSIAIGCKVFVNTGKSIFQTVNGVDMDVTGAEKAPFGFGLGSNVATGGGTSNIVIGGDSSARNGIGQAGGDQLVIGVQSHVIGSDSIAIGAQATVLADNAIALGGNYGGVMDFNSGGSIAIGVTAVVSNSFESVALGIGSTASSSYYSTVLGKRNAYAGVAAAMATQMPGTYVPGKTVMRVGTAIFKGEPAMGISLRRTSENNAWSITGGVGMSRAGAAATVGAEWVFN